MADLTYTVGVETTAAQRNVEALKQKIDKVQDSFGGLRAAIASLAIGAAIQQVVSYADSIDDLSKATNIAIANIIGFTKAVQLNGGDAEKAQQGLNKFILSIAEAADGSEAAQGAFAKVGVTLNDLRYLSEQDLLAKTIQGLSGITDISKRAQLATELFGKSLRGVDVSGLADSYQKATIESQKYAESLQKASELNQKLEIAVGKFKLALLQAIEPFVTFINKMDDEQIGKFIESIVQLGIAIGALAAAATAIESLVKLMGFLGGSALLLKGGFDTLKRTVEIIGWQLGTKLPSEIRKGVNPIEALGTTIKTIGTNRMPFFISAVGQLAKGMLGWTGVILGVNEALKLMTGQGILDWLGNFSRYVEDATKKVPLLGDAIAKVNRLMGVQSTQAKEANERLMKALEEDKKQVIAIRLKREEMERQLKMQREVKAADEDKLKSVENLSKAFRDQNNQLIQNLKMETELLGKSDVIIETERARAEVVRRATDEIKKLQDAKMKYIETSKGGPNKQVLAAYDAEISKVMDLVKIDKERIAKEVQAYQLRKAEIDEFNKKLEQQKELEEDMKRKGEELTYVYRALISPIEEATKWDQIRYDNAVKMRGQSDYAIETANMLLDLQEKQGQAQKYIAVNTNLTTDAQKMLTEQVTVAYNTQIELTKRLREEQYQYERMFSTGWTKAFNEYVNNATNAARLASEQFNIFTRTVDSAIDQLVENGKISFRDLVNSLIKELLKSELKAAIGNVAGAMRGITGGGGGGGGGGNFLSTLWNVGKSFLGFANGGMPPVNRPSIVGERGPELFIPKTAGTVIPNNQMGGTTNNTYITNNISALDAKSVAQLFAENRKTLLGTVRAAEKELPIR